MSDRRTRDDVVVERACAAEAVASALRHEVRNKLASTRNALTYIQRKLEGTDAWDSDERIARFFALAVSEVAAADEVLDERIDPAVALGRDVGVETLATHVKRAVAQLELPDQVEVDTDLAEQADVRITPCEAALLVRCLVENAVEACGDGGRVSVRVRCEQDGAVLEVADDGAGLGDLDPREALRSGVSSKPGRVGLGLPMAGRIARRYRGSLQLAREDSETVARVHFPPAEQGR